MLEHVISRQRSDRKRGSENGAIILQLTSAQLRRSGLMWKSSDTVLFKRHHPLGCIPKPFHYAEEREYVQLLTEPWILFLPSKNKSSQWNQSVPGSYDRSISAWWGIPFSPAQLIGAKKMKLWKQGYRNMTSRMAEKSWSAQKQQLPFLIKNRHLKGALNLVPF